MPISSAMNAKLNEQVTNEFVASQTYLAMACMFEAQGLKNLAGLFRRQTEEERSHAMKIIEYILRVEGQVQLGAIAAPPGGWPSVEAAIEAALTHERRVTEQVNELMALAEREKDYASRSFLTWYVDEQVEEVDSMNALLQAARLAGKSLLHLEAYVAHVASRS